MRAREFITQTESRISGYREIEFVCVNPRSCNATDPGVQRQMYRALGEIPNVIPLLQDWGHLDQGQMSLTAIYKGRESRQQILALAKKLGVEIDLEQTVSDAYVDRVIRGEHEGQRVKEDAFRGIDISMERDNDEIMVKATAGGKQLGSVLFVEYDNYLMPQDLEVDERFRGQGIAAAMYDYVTSQGYRIRRSGQQTDAGAGFWHRHKPGKNVWEQGITEVQILSKVKSKGEQPSNLPKFGREISPEQEQHYLGQKISKYRGHEIWRDYIGGQVSYHVFDPNSRTVVLTAFGSRYKENPNSFIIAGLYAAPGNPIRAHEFYRHLVRDVGLTLISDYKQSPGGQKVWQRLERYPDINIFGFDTRTEEVLNFTARDEEMYAVPSTAVKGREMQQMARDIRLVATAR